MFDTKIKSSPRYQLSLLDQRVNLDFTSDGSVANGAPLRLRVERQLGYKHAKYVMRNENSRGPGP
jgi:hypothetical protein